MESGNNGATAPNKTAPGNEWSWDLKESLKKISASATAVLNFLSNGADSAKANGMMDTGSTFLSKISEQKTETDLLALLNENTEEIADDPPSIEFLANNINNFKDKDLIDQTLQIFDIALGGPKDLKCSDAIVNSKFFWKKNIDGMYHLPDERLLNVLCKLANNVEKHQTIKFTVKQESALKERIEGIISGNEIGFIRYADQNQLASKLTVTILSGVCSRVASNPRSAYYKYKEIGYLLIKILWVYEEVEDICGLCLMSLVELTFKKDSAPDISGNIIFQINKYAGQVVKVMRRHIENTEILRNGFKVIANIACDEKAVRNIMSDGFVDLFRDAPDDDFNKESTYKYWRVRALWGLSRNPRSRSELETDPKIVVTMVEGLKDNWEDVKFAYPCCAFLDSIKMNDVVVKMFSDGVLDLLEKIKTRYKGDIVTMRAVRSLIEKLKSFVPDPSDASQQSMDDTQNELVNSQERFDGLSSSSSESLKSSSGSSLTLSKSPSKTSRSVIVPGRSFWKKSCISCYEKTSSFFYETLEGSLKTAEFVNITSMMKYSRDIARLLEKQGLLDKLKMTQADAMVISMYTYDNGEDHFEENPYRIVSKTLAENNMGRAIRLRGYVLRLLMALRKLPGYDRTKTLYGAVTNVSENYKKVGNILNWSTFTSTSSDEKSVIDFFNKIVVDGDRYILEITGCFKKGHSIRDFSFHSDEDEILFEPETRFKVVEVKPDTKVAGVTRIHVEVLDTPNILAEVVENFAKRCKEHIDDENFTIEFVNSGEKIAPYGGPVVPKAEWHGFWDDVKKAQTRYMGVKEALGFMGNGALREILVDGYKTALIDNEYCEGAEMMKGYHISVEEGAALYSYTCKYGESSIQGRMSPSCAVDGMVRGRLESPNRGMDQHGTNYLLHIASALEKLPMLVANNNEQKAGKRIYLCMKEDAAKALRAGEEYVLGSVFVGCAVRPSAGEGECVVCVEDAQLLCVREVGPLSAWGKGGYLLGLPGARIAVVTEFEEGGKGKDVVVRGVPVCEEEKGSYSECVKHFTFMIPLPENWSIETEEDGGRIFYQDNETDETQWERPVIEDPGFFTDFGASNNLN